MQVKQLFRVVRIGDTIGKAQGSGISIAWNETVEAEAWYDWKIEKLLHIQKRFAWDDSGAMRLKCR